MSLIPLLIPQKGYRGGARVVQTTDSGWATYSLGARLFLSAATNIFDDPQGTAQTRWPADTAHTDLTPNQALPVPAPEGMSTVTKCIKMVNDGTADAPQTVNLTVEASTAYASGVHIYAPTVGGNIVVTAEHTTAHTLGTITAANAGFVRYELATPTVAGEVTLALKFAFAGGTTSTIYVTGADVVVSPILAPHFDGTYPGCAWTSTANASTSTRTASSLVFTTGLPAGLHTAQTVAMRMVPLWNSATTGTPYRTMFTTYDGSAELVMLRKNSSVNSFWSYLVADASSSSVNSGALSYNVGDTHTFVTRTVPGAGGTLDLNRNGTDYAQAATALVASPATSLIVGAREDGTDPADAYIGPAIISPARKSDAWVAAIQASSGAAFGNLNILWSQYMVKGDLLLPLNSNGYGYVKR